MSNLTRIPSLRVSLRLQNGVFLINRVKRNGPVKCSGSRDYGSSFPTRYIPKKSSKNNQEERPPQTNGIKENDVGGREYANAMRFEVSRRNKRGVAKVILSNKERRDCDDKWDLMNRITVDSSIPEKGVIKSQEEVWMNDGLMESPFSEMEDEMIPDRDALDDELMKGRDVFFQESELGKKNIREIDVPCNGKTRKDAEDLAIQLLGSRAYTAVEMKKKLHGKRFSPAIVDAVIDDFQRRGLINDSLYAETFSQSRWSSSCWGPRRIKQELLRKGVSRVAVDKAVRQVFEGDEDSNSDEGSRLGLSRDSLNRLFTQASKQWLRSQGVPPETRKSRIVRWLQYRGFSWVVTSIILRRLESEEFSEMG